MNPVTVTRQAIEHLELANRIRIDRANLRKRIKAREVRVVEVLANPPECMMSATVEYVLLCARRVGPAKVKRVCKTADVPPLKRVRELSERQRDALILAVRSHKVFGS